MPGLRRERPTRRWLVPDLRRQRQDHRQRRGRVIWRGSLVDTNGRMRVTNKQAAQMPRDPCEKSGLQERDGVLVCRRKAGNQQLQAALAQLNLAEGQPGGQERAVVCVQSPRGFLPPTLVCLLALRPEATRLRGFAR